MRRERTQHFDVYNTWFLPLRLVVFLVVFGSILLSMRTQLEVFRPLLIYSVVTLVFFTSMLLRKRGFLSAFNRPLILMQLTAELCLESVIVYNSGHLSSPFAGLFLLTIVSASLAYRLVGTLTVATLASVAYSAAIWLASGSVVSETITLGVLKNLYTANDDIFFTVFIHLCIFYLTAFIAGYLADRVRVKDRQLLTASENLKQVRLETDEILRHLRSGLITVDNSGKIIYFNEAAEEITGFREREIKGKNCLNVFRERMPQFAEKVLAVLKSSQQDIRAEISIRREDGAEIPVGISTSILGDDRFGVRGVVAVFQDLTSAKETEERMRRADRLAAVGELAASIAHEIRNPLAAISGSVEVLQNELMLVGENDRLMNLILKESSRLNDILREFLDYARVKRPTFTKVEINHLILDVFDIVRHHTAYHDGINLEYEPFSTTEYIAGDEDMFKQFMLDLLMNSVEAIGDSNGTIAVEIENPDRGGSAKEPADFEWVRLSVADNGPGLPPSVKNRIFEPFFSTKKRGTGLGLPIVRRILENLGGRIEVDLSPGRGTKFTIYLKRYIDGFPSGLSETQTVGVQSHNHTTVS
ncbi:MAG: ATP-binding protein [Candidatus Zixiibacteriota bacterium]